MNIFEYRRIMIIGNNGSGKSFLSKRLAVLTGLPLTHLDAEYWQPNLTRPPDSEWRQRNIELTAAEAWILDGNFPQGGAIWNFARERKAGYLASREKYPGTPFFVIKGRRKMHRLLKEWGTRNADPHRHTKN